MDGWDTSLSVFLRVYRFNAINKEATVKILYCTLLPIIFPLDFSLVVDHGV